VISCSRLKTCVGVHDAKTRRPLETSTLNPKTDAKTRRPLETSTLNPKTETVGRPLETSTLNPKTETVGRSKVELRGAIVKGNSVSLLLTSTTPAGITMTRRKRRVCISVYGCILTCSVYGDVHSLEHRRNMHKEDSPRLASANSSINTRDRS
jgi:hypothetical protein